MWGTDTKSVVAVLTLIRLLETGEVMNITPMKRKGRTNTIDCGDELHTIGDVGGSAIIEIY